MHTEVRSPSGSRFPLHSPDFYAGDPYPAYRELRATVPVCWNDVTNYWALLKYEDVRFVSSNPATFSSTQGITIPDPALPSPVQPGGLIFTDPPRHRQMRKLINSGFTGRRVAVLEPKIRELVRGILDGMEPGSVHEFAEEIAAPPLPTRLIAELIGAPPDDWEQFRAWSDVATGTADPEIDLDPLVAAGQLFEYFQKLIAARRIEPRDDLLSVLAGAEIDGVSLTDEDLLNFAFLLLVAGNETTRNLIARPDIQTAFIYDHFTPFVFTQFEELGFCGRGEAKDFATVERLSLGGELPINTNGGLLGEAFIHGMNGITEGVRQIRGTSHNQVDNVEHVLVASGTGVPTSGLILAPGR